MTATANTAPAPAPEEAPDAREIILHEVCAEDFRRAWHIALLPPARRDPQRPDGKRHGPRVCPGATTATALCGRRPGYTHRGVVNDKWFCAIAVTLESLLHEWRRARPRPPTTCARCVALFGALVAEAEAEAARAREERDAEGEARP